MTRLRLFLLNILLGKEVQDMAVIYAVLISKKLKTIDDVPPLVRDQTIEILEACEVKF